MKLIRVLLLKVCLLAQLHAADLTPQWLEDYDQALSESQASGKPILVYFGADWCGPCQQFKKTVATQREFLDYAKQNLVLLHADVTSQDRVSPPIKSLGRRLSVDGIPHLALLDAEGQILQRKVERAGSAEGQIDILRLRVTEYLVRNKVLASPVVAFLLDNQLYATISLVGILLFLFVIILYFGRPRENRGSKKTVVKFKEVPEPETHVAVLMGQEMEYRLDKSTIYTSTMTFSLDSAEWVEKGKLLKLESGSILEFKPR